MAQPHTRSPVGGGKPAWGIATGRGTWNRTAIPRRMERSAKGIAGWILAKVIGVGPQASFQQEASQGQHAHHGGAVSADSVQNFLANSAFNNSQLFLYLSTSAISGWYLARGHVSGSPPSK